MNKRRYYAIDYRSMHTAVHGLLIFKDVKEAESMVKVIEDLLRRQDKLNYATGVTQLQRDKFSHEYNETLNYVFGKADNIIPEIDYRDIKTIIQYGKHAKIYKYKIDDKTIKVVNTSFDLYM